MTLKDSAASLLDFRVTDKFKGPVDFDIEISEEDVWSVGSQHSSSGRFLHLYTPDQMRQLMVEEGITDKLKARGHSHVAVSFDLSDPFVHKMRWTSDATPDDPLCDCVLRIANSMDAFHALALGKESSTFSQISANRTSGASVGEESAEHSPSKGNPRESDGLVAGPNYRSGDAVEATRFLVTHALEGEEKESSWKLLVVEWLRLQDPLAALAKQGTKALQDEPTHTSHLDTPHHRHGNTRSTDNNRSSSSQAHCSVEGEEGGGRASVLEERRDAPFPLLLPGQHMPGLGVVAEVGNLLLRMARSNGFDAVVNRPLHFHNAVMYARSTTRFLSPHAEGVFRRLVLDLLPCFQPPLMLSLGQVSRAIQCGCLRLMLAGARVESSHEPCSSSSSSGMGNNGSSSSSTHNGGRVDDNSCHSSGSSRQSSSRTDNDSLLVAWTPQEQMQPVSSRALQLLSCSDYESLASSSSGGPRINLSSHHSHLEAAMRGHGCTQSHESVHWKCYSECEMGTEATESGPHEMLSHTHEGAICHKALFWLDLEEDCESVEELQNRLDKASSIWTASI